MGWLVGYANPTNAESLKALICAPGGPGSTAEAQDRLNSFFGAFGTLVDLEITGEYHNTVMGCEAYIRDHSPAFGIFSLPLFLDWQKSRKLGVIGEVITEGEAEGRYYIVARAGGSLSDLRGKTLVTKHWDQVGFLSSVAFHGEIDLLAHFKGKKMSSGLRAIKKVSQGKADAALLDHAEFSSLPSLPLPMELVPVATSYSIPGAPLVMIGKHPGVEKALKKGLSRLCVAEKSACKALQLRQINPVGSTHYKEAAKLYRSKKP